MKRDPSCSGELRTAYVRRSHPTRWEAVGTYCDGCRGFWSDEGVGWMRPGSRLMPDVPGRSPR